MAAVAFSSAAFAYDPYAAPQAVGSNIDANKEGANLEEAQAVGSTVDANKEGANLGEAQAVGSTVDANKEGANLAEETEKVSDMLQNADNETGMGAPYSGGSAK